MFTFVKTLAANLIMPLPIALFMVFCGLVLLLIKRKRSSALLFTGAILVVFAASWAPVAQRLLDPLEREYSPITDFKHRADVSAVVLLGGGWDSERPWPASQKLTFDSLLRLHEALRILQHYPEASLVVSGGSRNNSKPGVAHGYAAVARDAGLPDEMIIVIDAPVNTAQEAYAVEATLGDEKPFFLVTSASHMPRAMRHFQRAGLHPIPAPTAYIAGREPTHPLHYWVPSGRYLAMTERALYERMGMLILGLEH